MITSISNNIRTNKIFYLKENTPLSMSRKKQKMQLSAVHLSSIIQSKKKEEVNEQMMELAKKINETNPFRPFLLTERPKSQHALNIRKSELTERNIYTSSGVKPKKSFNPSDFYLSDIIEEKWNDKFVRQSKQQLIRYQRSLSSKKAYKLRKYEFKIFLKQREAKPVETKAKEIKQIVYEKQQINKWGQLNPVLHTSRVKRFEQRRKNLDVQLKVQGNSFQLKKQKKQKQEQY